MVLEHVCIKTKFITHKNQLREKYFDYLLKKVGKIGKIKVYSTNLKLSCAFVKG